MGVGEEMTPANDLLMDIVKKEYRRLTERLECLDAEPRRIDVMKGAIQDCNSMAAMFKTMIKNLGDDEYRLHEFAVGRNSGNCAYCGRDRLDDCHEQP
jgi:hypothetical protein